MPHTPVRWALPLLLAGLLTPACAPDVPPATFAVTVLVPGPAMADGGLTESLLAGITLAGLVRTFEEEIIDVPDKDSAQAAFAGWLAVRADREDELLILMGDDAGEIVDGAGCQFDGRKVLLLADEAAACDDLRTVGFRTYAAAFQAGVFAVAISPAGQVGVLSTDSRPQTQELAQGFIDGAAHASAGFAGRWVASQPPTRATTAAALTGLLQSDVDVVFTTDALGFEAALAAGKGGDGPLLIATGVDRSLRAPARVAGSVLLRVDKVVRQAVLDMASRSFQPGRFEVGLDDGGTQLSINPAFDSARSKAEAARSHALAARGSWEERAGTP